MGIELVEPIVPAIVEELELEVDGAGFGSRVIEVNDTIVSVGSTVPCIRTHKTTGHTCDIPEIVIVAVGLGYVVDDARVVAPSYTFVQETTTPLIVAVTIAPTCGSLP